ncbi:DUF930 domain-containing protein [Roseibium aggregatum]|uniref:DUF930 domain-containing protein n=1 Tax=Roseibium aggregatum TaxID=187304 RepID=A0A939J2T6_9HYPH|nr:DUF930 domain-containing protein [Roseibium aggregatum]MBN9673526.1 DUF930 domain-containing protein [Roseibium aggregatum]
MDEASLEDRRFLVLGLAVSLALHVLAGVMLMEKVSGYETQRLQDAVEVELVPPPEEEPPAAEEEQEPEPEEPPAEEAPVPPPPPPAPEEQAEVAEQPSEVAVLQPVEEFGEEDTAPQEAEQGEPTEDTAEEPPETEAAEEEAPEEDAPEELEDAVAETEETEGTEDTEEAESSEEPQEAETTDSEEQATEEQATEEQVTEDQPAENEEENLAGEAAPPPSEDGELPAESFGTVGRIVTDATPAPKPATPRTSAASQAAATTGSAPRRTDLLPARELFSSRSLEDPRFRTAVLNMTPGERLVELCTTELNAQITAVSAVPPDALPRVRRRPSGNVLETHDLPFRSLGQWFKVSYRCVTDADVMRVEQFSFRIGQLDR